MSSLLSKQFLLFITNSQIRIRNAAEYSILIGRLTCAPVETTSGHNMSNQSLYSHGASQERTQICVQVALAGLFDFFCESAKVLCLLRCIQSMLMLARSASSA
jgi:hypothetical protein